MQIDLKSDIAENTRDYSQSGQKFVLFFFFHIIENKSPIIG
jgi:hypothetical protein